ncbi:putative late blight resistance protein homolog R1B-16 [Salvia hispanica]|uniref:putative late blight resistance protein homolog R1B-16 n=1 Tax=Salvia hispanica TaxID=49212 RepID=UPI00200955D0|nr:putative late blight resistance protein homolog R1B-16 [Salvia hispanica]
MAAYASLLSIMQIINQIKHHPSPPISMDEKQVESLTDIVMFLQEFLEGYKSPYAEGDEADPLEMRIADAVYAAEDVIESHIVDRIRPPVLDSYEALWDTMGEMDATIAFGGMLLRQILNGSSTFAEWYETLVDLIEWMGLIEDEVIKEMNFINAINDQVTASADLYKSAVKVIEHLNLIKKEVTEIVAANDQLQTQAMENADMCTSLVKVIEDMDLIRKEVMEIVAHKDKLQIQVAAASLGSSTSADLHGSLQKAIEDMDLIKKEVMEIVPLACGGSSTSSNMLRNNSSTSSLSRLNSATMAGFDDVVLQLMDKLTDGRVGRHVIPIVGMGGIGKTTLARNVYEKTLITHHFDICAWVTISQQFSTKKLLCEILFQANKEENFERLSEMREDEIGLLLHQYLSYRRFLIALDDMWSIDPWEKIQLYFPDNSNGSRIMVTTRLSNLGFQLDSNYGLQMKFMDEETSWNMFCKIVFGEESCPLNLEEIGKKIVKSCRGLPLSIVVIGGFLEKMEPIKEYWESIRRSINSLANLENDKHCLKILKLSYNHLPIYLKPCFLYMGTYAEDHVIQVSRLIKLWASEGFLKPISGKSLETIAKEYLIELVDRNLILVHELGSTGKIKYCRIHDLLRDLCLREAQKERFYDVVEQHNRQGKCSQRRVVIMRSTPKEKVVDALKSRPYARTCIRDCTRYEPFPNSKLLRTLKAWDKDNDQGGCECSVEKLFELVNLRFLDVKSDIYLHLPSSINLLWSLQTLIVHYPIVEVIHAPVEIWNMSQLRHIHLWSGEIHLPDPPSDSIVVMENLQTLEGVKNFKFDERMVRRMPNVKKLGLKYDGIESSDDESDDDCCVHNIKHLQKLESLRCFSYPGAKFLQKLTFLHSVKIKSLFLQIPYGRRMEDILEKVSTLPHLQKLILIGGDFTTGKWETVEGQFLSLKFLNLHCGDLKCWTMESSHFPCLEQLYLLVSSDMKEIPAELGEIPTLKSVNFYNCSESATKSAKRMVEEQEDLQGEEQLSFRVTIHLHNDEDNDELLKLATPNFNVVKRLAR